MLLNRKLMSYFKGCLRASPCLIVVGSALCYLLFQNNFGLYFTIFMLFIDVIAHLLKKIFKVHIYNGKKTIPFLGKGPRPKGARFSGCFIDDSDLKGISTSYGMPSGHAITVVTTCVMISWYIIQNYPDTLHRKISLIVLNLIGFCVLYSRLSFGCHSLNQVIVGALFGLLFGFLGIKLFKQLNI